MPFLQFQKEAKSGTSELGSLARGLVYIVLHRQSRPGEAGIQLDRRKYLGLRLIYKSFLIIDARAYDRLLKALILSVADHKSLRRAYTRSCGFAATRTESNGDSGFGGPGDPHSRPGIPTARWVEHCSRSGQVGGTRPPRMHSQTSKNSDTCTLASCLRRYTRVRYTSSERRSSLIGDASDLSTRGQCVMPVMKLLCCFGSTVCPASMR